MEKATIVVSKSKKGRLLVDLQFSDGKTMSLPGSTKINEAMNGYEVDVIREKGLVQKVTKDLDVLYEKVENLREQSFQDQSRGSYPPQSTARSSVNFPASGQMKSRASNPATAPYNFIPLNERVVGSAAPDHSQFTGNTGFIELEVEAKTAIFIRDTFTLAELDKAQKEGRSNDLARLHPDFFSPGGKLRIPGSSLRGMIRQIVNIISWSKFQQFDNTALFYRGVADQSNLGKEYNQRMIDIDAVAKFDAENSDNPKARIGVGKYKVGAGYFFKRGSHYFIRPAQKKAGKPPFEKYDGPKPGPFHYRELETGEYVIQSGKKFGQNSQHDVWKIYKPVKGCEQDIALSEGDISAYLNDKTRNVSLDYLKDAKGGSNRLIPCFYVQDQNGRISFGHTVLFRIQYLHSIGELVPSAVQADDETIDITESIFGRITSNKEQMSFKGKVQFSDAELVGDPKDFLDVPRIPNTLLGPKPTSFQHYLTQNEGADSKHLNHYDIENAQLRGFKMYWHQNSPNWFQGQKIDSSAKIDTIIQSVKAGARFKGKIYFEDLSEVELGALLSAIDLQPGCCHKIGMGKPIGLGSIRIDSKVYIQDAKNKYREIDFSKTILTSDESAELSKKAFETKVLSALQMSIPSLWSHPRLKALHRMLDYENAPESTSVQYMELAEFKKRQILPTPENV